MNWLRRHPRVHARFVSAHNVHGLSPREAEVFGLILEGRSDRSIARQLHVRPLTVQAYMAHVCHKLGVWDRKEALTEALRSGLFEYS